MRRGETNLYVDDFDRSTAFYGALGFVLTEAEADYRKLRNGDVRITLFPADGRPRMTADLVPDDFDDALAALHRAGVPVTAMEHWEGGRYALFRDPDGIGWELIEEI